MARTTPSPANVANTAQILKSAAVRSLLISVVINGALPLVIYQLLTHYTPTTQFIALVASGIPSVIDSIVGIIRRKRIDFLAGIVLIAIGVGLIVTILGGSPKVYLIRESFFTIAFGLAFFVSLFLPRPLMFYLARHTASGNDPANVARFNSYWQRETFRRAMRVMSAVWGIGLLLEAVIRISLVNILSVAQFLAVSPFVTYGIIAILFIWTFRFGRVVNPRGAEQTQHTLAEEQGASTTSTPTGSA